MSIMGCVYNLRGHVFNSQLELDSFLMDYKDLFNKYGDIVFLFSKKALDSRARLEGKKIDWNRGEDSQESMVGTDANNDIEPYSYRNAPKDWIGVTKFLQGLKDSSGKLLFPEFRKDENGRAFEYWNRRLEVWANSDKIDPQGVEGFTPEEAEIIFGENPPHSITASEAEDAIKVIEKKWTAQGEIGTQIHKLFELYFKDQENGKPVRELGKDFLLNKYMPGKLEGMPPQAIADGINIAEKLVEQLKDKFHDSNLIFIPEYIVKAKTEHINAEGVNDTLIGIIDLLVIDSQGNVHIVDYKTSPKVYGSAEYSSAKERTFLYQMATYKRILSLYGVNTAKTSMVVVPVRIKDLEEDEEGKWSYSGLEEWDGGITFKDLTNRIELDPSIETSIDEFLKEPVITEASTEKMLEDVSGQMKKWFPSYGSTNDTTDEEVLLMLGKRLENPINGKYTYTFPYHKPIECDTPEELISKVKEELIKLKQHNVDLTNNIARQLTAAQKSGNHCTFEIFQLAKIPKNDRGTLEWFDQMMARYCNENWEVIDCPQAAQFGCILLLNSRTQVVDVVKISSNYLYRPIKLAKSLKYITGNFESDTLAENRPNSMPLENVQGNIELMEAMLVLNNCANLFDGKANAIGDIQVLNPKLLQGLSAGNDQLLTNFNLLSKHRKLTMENNYAKKNIQLCDRVDLANNQFKEIMLGLDTLGEYDRARWSGLKTAMPKIEAYRNNVNIGELRDRLEQFRNQLLEKFPALKAYDPLADSSAHQGPEWDLFEKVTMAIAELRGAKFYQQLHEHGQWLDGSVTEVFSKGLQGLEYDNPGTTNSKILNEATREVTTAYQNVRADMDSDKGKIAELVEALKIDKGWNYFKDRTYGNPVDLYRNMFRDTDPENPDIILKNPDDPTNGMSEAERNFVRYFLETVNAKRFSHLQPSELEKLKVEDAPLYYRVPLTWGDGNSVLAVDGVGKALKSKLNDWKPSNIVEHMQRKIDGIITEEDRQAINNKGMLWEMVNCFDAGEVDWRRHQTIMKAINGKNNDGHGEGLGIFEHNLETLLLKHRFAYSQLEQIDKVLPTMEALTMHLATQGKLQNGEFTPDLQYMKKYIRNKVFNQSIMDENSQIISAYTQKAMGLASKLALGLSPTLFYQYLDGFWKAISLGWRKPDGSQAFSVANLRDSYFFVAKDFIHFGDSKTKCELLNEYFGLNDMDMNTYTSRIGSNQYNFWNADQFLFRFASRPDYYNRSMLFGAHMREDGCWDAYEVKDGKLVYNWENDARFNIFAKAQTNPELKKDPEYKKLEAMYWAIANLLVREGTIMPDGTLFRLDKEHPVALPKAYTTLQSEAYKDEADMMYGYYSHEKKSLIQSSLIGGMFFQMYTYWSGKKNQYLQGSGIKAKGRMAQYSEIAKDENGDTIKDDLGNPKTVKYCLDKDGNPVPEDDPNSTGVPFMVWQGQFEEGILITMAHMMQHFWQGGARTGNFKEGWEDMMEATWNNEDENVRRACQSNLKLFIYDSTMFLLLGQVCCGALGDVLKEYEKNHKNDTLMAASCDAAYNLGLKIVSQSFSDMNFIDSVAGRFSNWNPFALSSLSRLSSDYIKVVTGDKRFYDAFINSFTATRSTKPLWEYLNPKEAA